MTEDDEVHGELGREDYLQAEWLGVRFRKKWRYDHTAKRWHHFNGLRWAPDETNRVSYEVRRTTLRALEGAKGESETKRLMALLQMPTIKRVLEALASFPDYGTNGDEWDSNPVLLGVANGVVDLRLNALVDAEPSQNITRTTKIDFEPISGPEEAEERAPTFMRVMREWTSDDENMIWFLLFWFGSSLFGFSPEQRFLIMTGGGRNGKGALKHSCLQAMGEYAAELDPGIYMRSKMGSARSNEARADLLKLKGLRATFFSEPQGGQFNEELLKAHTGGDRITARALYSNNIQTWEPTHSITFLTNNLPDVEDVGPSMAERVMVADFRESYEGDKQDRKLYDKLTREAEGILAILVWAASIWFLRWENDRGLVMPERVLEQSRQFMERNDPIANWQNDWCERGRDLSVASQVAYESYLEWHTKSHQQGEAMSQVKFANALQKKGYTKQKTRTGARWYGFDVLGFTRRKDLDEDEDPS